ncbi:MAG: tRNA dihydrouridine synthase DusB [bacterium]
MDTLQTDKTKLTIGNLKFNSNVTLAPMAGVTDTALRQIIRLHSKDSLLVSEMLSSEALKMNTDKSILNHVKEEHPLAFQIAGHKPYLMAEGAKQIESISTLIDINMGCPVAKIVKNGDGSALMTDLKLASEIISSIKNSVSIPVTVKCRIGWDCNTKNHVEFAKMAEESGADAITVHGRTRTQMYAGQADWYSIAEVKNAVKIPVIANGDINSPQSAAECLKISNADGVAIGRGILGDVSLMHRIDHYLKTGELIEEPDILSKLEIALLHTNKEIELKGELHGIKFMRKFYAWYIKSIKNAVKYRTALVRVEKLSEIYEIFEEIRIAQKAEEMTNS